MEEGRGMVVEQSVCVNKTKRNGRGTGMVVEQSVCVKET